MHTVVYTNALQQIDCTHHIGFVGISWISVAVSHNRLRCHVDDHFRLCFIKAFFQMVIITNITYHAMHMLFYICQRKQIRLRWRA